MKLTRPLISFDLETTGIDPESDRIVEIACIKMMPDGQIINKFINKVARLNPTIPIPQAATNVHGINDVHVFDAPTFKRIASSLFKFMDGCDLTGYNIVGFDIPLLSAEFRRVGSKWPAADVKVVDAYGIVVRKEPRDLTWALKKYCDKDLENAHSATADAKAALDVLMGQAQEYFNISSRKYLDAISSGEVIEEPSIDDLRDLSRDPDSIDLQGKFKVVGDKATITFGKHNGKSLSELPLDYLQWMLGGTFLEDVKKLIHDEITARRASRKMRVVE